MKRINKILILTLLIICIMLGSSIYATESTKITVSESDITNEYVVIREMTYKNQKSVTLPGGFVEIKIGGVNFVPYQKDMELKITPTPNEIRKDDYGNIYAYYDSTGFETGTELKVKIERRAQVGNLIENVILSENYIEVNKDNNIYLEEQTKIESANPKIIAKSKELTKHIDDDYEKALSIFEYVNTKMDYVEDPLYVNKGALSALETHKGVCEEFATLFVALCRASDIPARVIEGFRLVSTEDKDGKTGEIKEKIKIINHAWAEIYIEEMGWIPVEPTVIYTVNGQRRVYMDSFGKLPYSNYIALGVYNSDRANRTMRYITELELKEIVENIENIEYKVFTFKDVTTEYAWSEIAIKNLYQLGIVNGYNENEYRPGNNISRIEFICMLSRTLKYMNTVLSEPKGIYYHMDYNRMHWSKKDYDFLMRYYQAVNPNDAMIAGYYDLAYVFGNKMDVDKPITRAEVVALMDTFLTKEPGQNVFTDISETQFMNSILKSYANDLIIGYPDGTFKPNNLITRAEMATILNRYIENNITVIKM